MRRRKRRPAPLLKRLRRALLWALLGVVGCSLAVVVLLRWVDPPWSAVMLQRLASEGRPQYHVWVDMAQIDPHLALAVIAAEDQRFPEHWGFDTGQILAALEQRLDGGRLRGASTISQQVARNLFLWQGRSFVRKGLEVWFTGMIEAVWPKRRILEMYLNFAEMGPRTFGVGAASARYLGHTPQWLGSERAALIAAVLPNPRLYRIDNPSDYVLERREWILQQMHNLGGPGYLDDILKTP